MECKNLGMKKVSWQSAITSRISLDNLKEIETKMNSEQWDNCGNMLPHVEKNDMQKNREKVIKFLDENIEKQGLVSIKNIAEELRLTEEFVIGILQECGMEITEE